MGEGVQRRERRAFFGGALPGGTLAAPFVPHASLAPQRPPRAPLLLTPPPLIPSSCTGPRVPGWPHDAAHDRVPARLYNPTP